MNHFYLIAVCSGAAIATQAAMNAQLGQLLGSPLLASSVAFGSALLFAVLAVLVSSHSPPAARPWRRCRYTCGLAVAF